MANLVSLLFISMIRNCTFLVLVFCCCCYLGNQSNIAGMVEAMGWCRIWQDSGSRNKQEKG